MAAVVTTGIDEDIWQDVWDEERSWREDGPGDEGVPDPLALVIFGATGDLSHRKLIPALYNLHIAGLLPKCFSIVGFGRSDLGEDAFRKSIRDSLGEAESRIDESKWNEFSKNVTYFRGAYDQDASFEGLSELLDQIDEEQGTENHRLFYLATPPNVYADVVARLGAAGLNRPQQENGWTRLIVEKPFGRDLETARRLDRCIHDVFDESQVFRIDHYLGKETVQNIFVLRFINGIFEPLWNRNYVDNVQITVSEVLGVEGRGGYYEEAGAIRDMLQSHLLQLLTLTAMEPPSAFSGDKVRDEKVKVLDSLHYADRNDIRRSAVRAQYSRGMLENRYVPGYREERGVSPRSLTPTYVAAKFMVDNWRWAGVPFYLRTGKRMSKRVSEIAVQFRRAPHMFLPGGDARVARNNVLVIRIQPDDGLALRLEVKVPGVGIRVRPVDMAFLYKQVFEEDAPDAYQRLLLDAMKGDNTLFTRSDEVEAAWSLVTPLLDSWEDNVADEPATYTAGSWGPQEADDLLAQCHHRWRKP